MKWLIISMIIITAPLHAAGNDEIESTPYELDGIPGIWMPLDMAKKAIYDLEYSKHLKLSIHDLELKLDIKDERIGACREALSLEKEATNRAFEAAEEFQKEAASLREEKDKWYNKPVFWFGSGVVVVIILEIGGILIYSSL